MWAHGAAGRCDAAYTCFKDYMDEPVVKQLLKDGCPGCVCFVEEMPEECQVWMVFKHNSLHDAGGVGYTMCIRHLTGTYYANT